MKTVFLMLAMMMSSSAFAGYVSFTLPKDTIAIEPVAGELLRADSLCPTEMWCKRGGSALILRFEVGCMNDLANVTYQYDYDSDILYVSAMRAITKDSLVSFCVAPTFKTAVVTVDGIDELAWNNTSKIVYLGTGGDWNYPTPGTPVTF